MDKMDLKALTGKENGFAVLTDKELAHVMYTLSKLTDDETRHRAMDQVMVDLLRQLCYGKAMDIYEKTEKWYA